MGGALVPYFPGDHGLRLRHRVPDDSQPGHRGERLARIPQTGQGRGQPSPARRKVRMMQEGWLHPLVFSTSERKEGRTMVDQGNKQEGQRSAAVARPSAPAREPGPSAEQQSPEQQKSSPYAFWVAAIALVIAALAFVLTMFTFGGLFEDTATVM